MALGLVFARNVHLSHGDLQSEHDRPYAIPSSDLNYCGIPNNTEEGMSARNLFSDLRTSKCKPDPEDQQIIDSGDVHRRILLGRVFVTDVQYFESHGIQMISLIWTQGVGSTLPKSPF